MNHVFIIGEAGVNHNGDPILARKLIDAAIEAGADAIKFQTFKAENLVRVNAQKAEYQKNTTDPKESQLDMLRRLQLSFGDFENLKLYCDEKGIQFLSSPFDIESANFLHDLGIKMYKIPSGEITNVPLLRFIGSFHEKVILSTGMSTLGEIEYALEIIIGAGTKRNNIALLHCNTEYPTPYADVNLQAMCTIRQAFQLETGYSDHTDGLEVPIAAVALGAGIIEKHFTLSRQMVGPDHKASLEPSEFKNMVDSIRNIELALGSYIKAPSHSEINNQVLVRKSIVAKRMIAPGEVFTEENIATKRPADGLSPIFWDQIIGRKARRLIEPDEKIQWQDIE